MAAGNRKLIEDIINEPKAKAQVDALIKELDRAKKVIQEFPQIYGDFKNGGQAFSQMQTEIDKLKVKQKEMITMSDQLNKANAKRIQLESDAAKELAKTNIQNAEKNKKLKEEAKEVLGLTNEYDKLVKKYNEAAREAKKLAVQHGANSKVAKEAAESAMKMKKQIDTAKDSVGDFTGHVGDYKNQVKELFGQVAPEANEVVEKVEQIGGAFAKFGPWGAAIGVGIMAIAAPLKAFFSTTQEGMDRMTIRSAGFSAAMSVVTGDLSKIGKGIDDAFGQDSDKKVTHFWQNFLGVASGALTNYGAKMDAAANKGKEIARARIELEKEEIELIVQRAQANENLVNTRMAASDENRTIAEKIELYKSAFEQENAIAEKEIESAKRKVEIVKKNNELSVLTNHYNREENKKALKEAEAEVIKVREESERRQIKARKNDASLRKELRQEEADYDISLIKDRVERQNAANARILANERSTLSEKIRAERSNMEESLRLKSIETTTKLNVPGMDDTKRNTILKEAQTERFKIISDEAEKERKLLDDYNKRNIVAENDLQKTRLQAQKDEFVNELSIDQQLYESRMTFEHRISILQKTTNLELQEEDLNYNKIKTAAAWKTAAELEAIEEEHARKIRLIQTKSQLEQIAVQKEYYQKSIAKIQGAGVRSDNASVDSYNSQLQGLSDQLGSGSISVKSFDRQKNKLDKTAATSSIDQQLSTTRQLQEAAIKADDLKAADNYEKHILELTKQRIDAQIDLEKKSAEERKMIEEKTVELGRKTMEFVINQQKNQIEKERNQLSERLQNIETAKAADIVRITDSTLAEDEKSVEIKRINAEELLQKQEIAAEEKKLKLKQAKADKEMALFNAIINTAIAVTSALSAGPGIGIALAFITAAMGALEIATIASKPIPAYAEGTLNSKAGLALTDEKNPEGYITPSGSVFIGSNRPNIKKLEAGTKIFPNVNELNNYLLASMMQNGSMNISDNKNDSKKMDQLIMATHAQTTEITRALKKNKPNVTVNTKVDIGYQQYINNQVKN